MAVSDSTRWPEVKDVVGIVIDSNHPKFRQLAAVTRHDWRESGIYAVRYVDGSEGELCDGWQGGIGLFPAQLETFYRGNDPIHLAEGNHTGHLVIRATGLGRSLDEVEHDYRALFGESLPRAAPQEAQDG